MRVLVFSTPRSCSSYVIHILSNVFDIKNYNELFDQSVKPEELPELVETKLYGTDDYAVKFMSGYFTMGWLDFDDIKWDMFDHIVFTERDDITSHIASWYAIFSYNQDLNQKLVRGEDVVEDIQDRFFDNELISFKETFKNYNVYKNKLLKLYPEKCITLKYELFQKPIAEYLPVLNEITKFNFEEKHLYEKIRRKIDYRKVFSNYDKLEEIVTSWGNVHDN